MTSLHKILFLLNLISIATFAQVKFNSNFISPETNKIVKELMEYQSVTDGAVGIAGIETEQYNLFEKLKHISSENELYELTNHESPIIRAYAFTALIDQNSPKAIDVLVKNQFDTTLIHIQFGCVGDFDEVIGYMLDIAKPYLEKNSLSETQLQLIAEIKEKHYMRMEIFLPEK